MNVSRNTVYNRFVKGSEYLNKVLPILKVKLLGSTLPIHKRWTVFKIDSLHQVLK